MPDWQMAMSKSVSPAHLRLEYVHAHAVGLHALGLLGRSLIEEKPNTWVSELAKLRNVDWRKTNPEWLRRTMSHGKLSKATAAIRLTCNSLKIAMDLPLSEEEKILEQQLSGSK